MKEQSVGRPDDKSLLEFARSYLSEAFPNPSREGCPAEDELRLLASRPKQADLSLTEHLSCCSSCFRQYQTFLAKAKAELKAKRMSAWEGIFARTISSPAVLVRTLAIAAAVGFAGYVLLIRLEHRKTLPPAPSSVKSSLPSVEPPAGVEYSKFVLDLSSLSPTRGSKRRAVSSHRRVRLPSSPLDLTLSLPVGSEEQSYRVALRSGRQILWAKSAQAYLQNGHILLRVEADFRKILAGTYNLEVESSTGIRLSQPVLIEAAFPKGAEQKR